MKKSNRILLIFLALVIPVFLLVGVLGPRVEFVVPTGLLEISTDIQEAELQIKASEALFSDIRPGTEKKIFWANPEAPARTPLSIIYLHGYTATRREVSPVVENVAKSLGANLFMTRLAGHGRTADAHKGVTTADWIRDALEALQVGKVLGEKVLVIGTSTGGTLASWLTLTQPPGTISGVVLISPNYGPQDSLSELVLWPWGNLLVKAIVGDYREFEKANEDQAYFWDTRHHSDSLLPMMALVRHVREMDHTSWKPPVLILFSSQDSVVNPQITLKTFSAVEHAQVVELPISQGLSTHVIAGAILNHENTALAQEKISKFALEVLERR